MRREGRRDEIGSEYHWEPSALLDAPHHRLPDGHRLFATATGALRALLRQLAPAGRLHVPTYFCTGVAEALAECVPIAWYQHLPLRDGPDLETLHARPGDVVLAQNLFGVEDPRPWREWIAAHPGVPVVEDHSHDPFGDWARHSTAAYAVASLRKTLPLPDGGLLWSPSGRPLPGPDGPESRGAAQKLAAMLLKAAWRDGRPVAKGDFRALQQHGERALLCSAGPASAVTAALLPLLDVAGLRDRGRAAAGSLRHELLSRTRKEFDLVVEGPFRLPLACASETARDALLAHLARHRIFAPVHWRQERRGWWSGDRAAAALAARMLTLPVDHRCSSEDVQRIAHVMVEFTDLASCESKVGHIVVA
ncbi:hypothetical protein [Actinoplanes sp. NPDC051851]|uniref:hypothetical protein n=1 Tax=Actinoplanes sp. NPDC051851 TaxID=3154753 RepID=UPI0034432704